MKIILGISTSHDSGATLIIGGKLVAAVNEERLTRKKMATGFPSLSIKQVLRIANVPPHEVEGVAVAGRILLGAMPLNADFTLDDGRIKPIQLIAEYLDRINLTSWLIRRPLMLNIYRLCMPKLSKKFDHIAIGLKNLGIQCDIRYFDHHLCHLASGYYFFQIKDALVISTDGFGDGLSGMVAVGDAKSGTLHPLKKIGFIDSIGTYYNFATKLCGFKYFHHAGKVTGLAAYGSPNQTLPFFKKYIDWDEDRGQYVNLNKIFRNGLNNLKSELSKFSPQDIAAGIQLHTENTITQLARFYMAKTSRAKVVLTGGVHANVKLNQKIAELPGIEEVYIYPNMGDGGLSAGAAWLYAVNHQIVLPENDEVKSVYLGPAYSNDDVLVALVKFGCDFYEPSDWNLEQATLLNQNKILARFDGRMEYGPRSLGNRSILYTAVDKSVNTWLNDKLNRTEFMPFAPIIRHEDAENYLINYDKKTELSAQFMTITYKVKDKFKQESPAAVHIDGTARPQVLKKEFNPSLYDLLTKYKEISGLSIIVNTSFNMHEEPIVCSPEDAIRAFKEGELDVLAIGKYIVLRQPLSI